MTAVSKYQRTIIVTCIFAMLVIVFARCINNGETKEDVQNAAAVYAGDEKCASCHRSIFDTHLKTAHHLTSQTATENNIGGTFKDDKNYYLYNPTLKVAMEKRDSGLYQVVYINNDEKMAMRFDVVVGSGRMGQSYLTERDHRYYQMPVSFFTAAHQWSNSPGFPPDRVLVDRPVSSRCIECHATYAQVESETGPTGMEPPSFQISKTILGVGCEKCHGPAERHVAYQTAHPLDTTAKYIVNPGSLSRQLQLDICASCHGGKIKKIQPSFSFIPGESLSKYFAVNDATPLNAFSNVEVHGNQYGLLRASKCFMKSNILTCNTCHNSHENERGNKRLFSSRCMTCHNTNEEKFKTATHKQVTSVQENCIDCHMPQQPSRAIAVFLEGTETPLASMIRSHFIAIYVDEAKKYIRDSTKKK